MWSVNFAKCTGSFCGRPWFICAPRSLFVSLAFGLCFFAYLLCSMPILWDSLRSISFRSSELEGPRGVLMWTPSECGSHSRILQILYLVSGIWLQEVLHRIYMCAVLPLSLSNICICKFTHAPFFAPPIPPLGINRFLRHDMIIKLSYVSLRTIWNYMSRFLILSWYYKEILYFCYKRITLIRI